MERIWQEKGSNQVVIQKFLLTEKNIIMQLEINLNGRTVKVNLIEKENNKIKIAIGQKVYDLDIVLVEKGIYSIIIDDNSYNVELIEGRNSKNYIVNAFYNSYDIEIVDAESKYIKNRQKGNREKGENTISSPMPGKIVKIPVNIGDQIKSGQTAIIVSAMKMESEYKLKKNGVIKEILVKEGDTVEGNQTLIVIE